MSEVHHNVNTGYLWGGWVGDYFLIPKRDNYYLYTFFLCRVLFISLWFLNTKGIYVEGYILLFKKNFF